MEEKIAYEIEQREEELAQIAAAGKAIMEDVTIDLVGERLSNCYFVVTGAPAAPPDLLAETDEYILELEYQNLLLKEELADAANL